MRKGDDLTTFIVLKVEKIRKALTFRISKGLLRPVAGKRYLYLYLLQECIACLRDQLRVVICKK